jgi:hypothetical protein
VRKTTQKRKAPSLPGKKPRGSAQALLAKLRKEPNELKKKMLLLGFLSDEPVQRSLLMRND